MNARVATANGERHAMSALETLVDLTWVIAIRDVEDNVARAGLNLIESIGRTAGVQLRVLGEWIEVLAKVVREAVDEGDPGRFFTDLEHTWKLLLPGFANPDRIEYVNQFVARRAARAVKTAAPLDP